jgi:membrane fusion protein, multidrug efflux system
LDVQVRSGLTATDRIVANPSLGLLEGQEVKVPQATQGYKVPGSTQPTQ